MELTAALEQVKVQNSKLESLSHKLSKYLSPQVYSTIFSGHRAVEISSTRKKLTVFFSDIVGFTEISDSIESEELTELLNHYLTEMSAIALAHGATIDKFIGDAIMIFFGDPETEGPIADALSCVEMSIAMQKRMRELRIEWQGRGIERPFELRIGIATGYCTVGNFGSVDRMDYTIIGNEVNLAARLQAEAEPGEILLAHETYSLVKPHVIAEERQPVILKGFSKPVRAYRLVGNSQKESPLDAVVHLEGGGANIHVELARLEPDTKAEVRRVALQLLDALAK
jgi:class 3 adenylate cyclase